MDTLLQLIGIIATIFIAICYGYYFRMKEEPKPPAEYCIDGFHRWVLDGSPNGKMFCSRCHAPHP